jgi:glycine/D-amino acid oxidase-like deaminating enzyme
VSAPGAPAAETPRRFRSLWLDGLDQHLAGRPSLPGDRDADIAVVGAGFTGLWTAHSLARLDPRLRIVVLEAEIAGYGAAGRNAGFVSAGIAGETRVYERRGGRDGVARAERTMIDGIDEIGHVIADEGIDCGYVKPGSFRLATSRPQLERVLAGLEARRARGYGEEDVRFVDADEIERHVRVPGVLGGAYTPHCGRVHPGRLVRGLAEACERRGVTIYEHTRALAIEPGRVVCDAGAVRAGAILRATESYTGRLPGERRRFLPVWSHMVATEPLPAEAWEEIGWAAAEPLADQRHLFLYAQRTRDGRIALGGRCALVSFASRIRDSDEERPGVYALLEEELRRAFPAAAGATVTHRWGGTFAVPRDWSMSVRWDPGARIGWAGGYSGHGVVASNVAGRTLADLVLGRETELTALPWVGHSSGRWEPEPLRWLGARAIVAVLAGADRAEGRRERPARRTALARRFLPSR